MAATFEACIWIPFFLFFALMVMDASAIFSKKAQVSRILQDGNRQFVKGAFGTATTPMATQEQALETWIAEQLAALSIDTATTVDASVSGGLLTTLVEYSAADTDISGSTGLAGLTVRTGVVNQLEM